jgi:hypothetical protein
MKKEKNVKVKESIGIVKLNIRFLDFVNEIKENLNKISNEELRKFYLDFNNKKSSKNIDKVIKRVFRDELKEVLNGEIEKRGLSFEEFKGLCVLIEEKVRGKSVNNNYLDVEVFK